MSNYMPERDLKEVRIVDSDQHFDKHDWRVYSQPYKKKPVVIKALRLEIAVEIDTPEGVMRGNVGDWLIEGVSGEFYPCKDKIFRKTYEAAQGTMS